MSQEGLNAPPFFCILPKDSQIHMKLAFAALMLGLSATPTLAHTNDYISKEKFVAAGAGLQFAFGLGAMSGPFLCSIFMDLIGPNGFFVFLFLFHSIIGIFGIYRMRVRQTVDNPDSQFVAMPQTITPAGIELNPQTEPISDPIPGMEANKDSNIT